MNDSADAARGDALEPGAAPDLRTTGATVVRAHIPFHIYVSGPSPDGLQLSATFDLSRCKVSVTSKSDSAFEVPSAPLADRFAVAVTELTLVLQDSDAARNLLAGLLPNRVTLTALLVRAANAFLTAIRNFGTVPHIAPFRHTAQDAESILRHWAVETSNDGETWTAPATPPKNLFDIFGFSSPFSGEMSRSISKTLWSEVTEALEDGLLPAPEQEFVANALEHIHRGNFRLAVVESIVCLEIVLTQFLRAYLTTSRQLPASHVNKFLTPSLTLFDRLSVILDLTLSPEELGEVDVTRILTTVSWRNTIVHRTGRLPDGLTENDIRTHLSLVLMLAFRLGHKRDQIMADPSFRTLAQTLETEFKLPAPAFRILSRHHVGVTVLFTEPPWKLPEAPVLEQIARRVGALLHERDPRFVSAEHLSIRFQSLLRDVHAVWRDDKLTIVGTPSQANPYQADA
jgi:hypothetical protein